MRFVSWNVNGLRAVMKKGFPAVFDELNADVFALQETKLQPEQIQFTKEEQKVIEEVLKEYMA